MKDAALVAPSLPPSPTLAVVSPSIAGVTVPSPQADPQPSELGVSAASGAVLAIPTALPRRGGPRRPSPEVPSDPAALDVLAGQLEQLSAEERVAWALETFGERLVSSTSFGVQAAVMLHLVASVAPGLPVIFVDTGYLFPETYQFAEELTARLGLNLKVYQAAMTPARQEALYGRRWEQGLEALQAYNFQNKVEPMNRALQELGATAWLAGLRRNQSSTRAALRVIEPQRKTTKLYPIVDWTDRDIYQYLTKYDLPYHPLWDRGYVSVGDVHSTSPLTADLTPEQTRFNGLKRECGLHEVSDRVDFQI